MSTLLYATAIVVIALGISRALEWVLYGCSLLYAGVVSLLWYFLVFVAALLLLRGLAISMGYGADLPQALSDFAAGTNATVIIEALKSSIAGAWETAKPYVSDAVEGIRTKWRM